jgi:hypothetical protein
MTCTMKAIELILHKITRAVIYVKVPRRFGVNRPRPLSISRWSGLQRLTAHFVRNSRTYKEVHDKLDDAE